MPHGFPRRTSRTKSSVRAPAAAAGRFATEGYATVYDGVIGPWFIPTFAQATGLDGLQCVVLLPALETCVARVATRQGHGFTDEAATRKMHEELEPRSTAVTYSPICLMTLRPWSGRSSCGSPLHRSGIRRRR